MTKEATKDFCLEMIKFSSDYLRIDKEEFWHRCVGYFDQVFEYNREKTLQNHLDELQALSPFPEDLRGFIHEYNGQGVFQPKHLMFKLATYRDDATKITYEFLFEYDITDPTTEIYYGIKAISDDPKTTAEFEEKVHHIAWEWRDYIRNKDRSQGSTANYYKRHKLTNNAHDGTFWISWVRVESYESLDHALKDLENKTMETFLKFKHFQVEDLQGSRFDDTYNHLAEIDELPGSIKESEIYKQIPDACAKFNIGGKPILTRLSNGLYKFDCTDKQAMIFIEYLYNPKPFDEALKSNDPHDTWKQKQKQKQKQEQEQEQEQKQKQKQKIVRDFVAKVFRDKNCKPLPKGFCENTKLRLSFISNEITEIEAIYHPK
ncbi:MAG: hypothetical protein HDT09_03135 [Bacteroidales bacterium]|nr:hypothetical protein [Bacteroidales bacterium]